MTETSIWECQNCGNEIELEHTKNAGYVKENYNDCCPEPKYYRMTNL